MRQGQHRGSPVGTNRKPCLLITMGVGVTDAHIFSIGHHEGCSWGTNSLKVFFVLPSTLAGDTLRQKASIKELLHFCQEDTEVLFWDATQSHSEKLLHLHQVDI